MTIVVKPNPMTSICASTPRSVRAAPRADCTAINGGVAGNSRLAVAWGDSWQMWRCVRVACFLRAGSPVPHELPWVHPQREAVYLAHHYQLPDRHLRGCYGIPKFSVNKDFALRRESGLHDCGLAEQSLRSGDDF